MVRPRLAGVELLMLFVVGAAGGLIGDQGHVVSGTTRYLATGVPFIWKSALWFPVLVGGATAALGELRLRIARPRPQGDIKEAVGAIASIVALYAVTAVVRHSPLVPATALVFALAALVACRFGDGRPAILCGLLAAVVGSAIEMVMVAAGVFEYGQGVDGLGGVAPWLPALYFAFGVVAARLGELLAARRSDTPPR
jgi:hypothetical protein